MLMDCYGREDVFAQLPELAAEIDPVLRTLDGLLDDDQLYQQVRADEGSRHRYTKVAWAPLHACRSEARVC
jgi:transposase, IS5 family